MNKKDFADFKYPIHLLKPGESVFDLADLKPLKEIFSKPDGMGLDDPEFVMKYIILMYTPGSPAISKLPHLGKRKTWVLDQLGVTPDESNRYPDHINYLALNRCPTVVRKITTFLTLQGSNNFAIMRHAHEELHTLLGMPEFSTETKLDKIELTIEGATKRRKLIEETREQYESAKARLLENDKSRIIEEDVDIFMAQTLLGIRHEEFLTLIAGKPMLQPKDQKADQIFPGVGN